MKPSLFHQFIVSFVLLTTLDVGVSAQLGNSAEIDSYLRNAVQTTKIPGLVAIVVDSDGITYSASFGHQNVAADIPMSVDTLFNIASMTKPIAATAIMMLVEEGKLDLGDPISRYLPQLGELAVLSELMEDGTYLVREPEREMTVRDLMSHSSGLAYGFSNKTVFQLNGGLAFADNSDIALLYDPGTTWSYGTGIGIVATVLEIVSGQSLDAFLRERIFQPLGMSDTGYVVPAEDVGRVATTHRMTEKGLVESPVQDEIRSKVSGNGGLYSTVVDYAKFIQLFLNSGISPDGVRILKEESICIMGANQLGSVRVSLQEGPVPLIARAFPLGAGRDMFGIGFQVTGKHDDPDIRSPGSLSWAGLLNTQFWIDREKGIGAVLLMQYLPFYDDDAIVTLTGFERLVYEELRKRSGRDRLSIRADTLQTAPTARCDHAQAEL